ncbi:hypothetical protein QBC40DRAFT_292119 [Triangularia verruculosa]|uniref:Uncharacterized protein n=1 Tax=Triangularia verruculosa TaxID=2587418 RepID=A0AAN6XX34_9PEZI|nr:hypothetical protein QBC40DRAFT_292119 [Triangularia verruculosa]
MCVGCSGGGGAREFRLLGLGGFTQSDSFEKRCRRLRNGEEKRIRRGPPFTRELRHLKMRKTSLVALIVIIASPVLDNLQMAVFLVTTCAETKVSKFPGVEKVDTWIPKWSEQARNPRGP